MPQSSGLNKTSSLIRNLDSSGLLDNLQDASGVQKYLDTNNNSDSASDLSENSSSSSHSDDDVDIASRSLNTYYLG
jgi:hypothetical protein